jgi:pre-rRNA-processing protein TSR2
MSATNNSLVAPNGMPSSATSSPASAKIDLFISLQLHSWPALTLAIQNHWGGPASIDKRDWFAGAVSELLTNGEVADVEDLEEVLIQVMLDEFEVVVDDDSPAEIAASIMKGRQRILQGDLSDVDRMLARWEKQQKKGQEKLVFKRVEEEDDGQDTDWESSDEEEEDAEMEDAPQLVPTTKQEKPAPEVDEDGFTKVVGKKKR